MALRLRVESSMASVSDIEYDASNVIIDFKSYEDDLNKLFMAASTSHIIKPQQFQLLLGRRDSDSFEKDIETIYNETVEALTATRDALSTKHMILFVKTNDLGQLYLLAWLGVNYAWAYSELHKGQETLKNENALNVKIEIVRQALTQGKVLSDFLESIMKANQENAKSSGPQVSTVEPAPSSIAE